MPNGVRKQIEEFRSQVFKREYLGKVKPFPKVKELFAHIKAKRCKLVLASSCSTNEIDQYKAIAGIADITDHDVTADDAGTSKPSPEIFLKALDRLLRWWGNPNHHLPIKTNAAALITRLTRHKEAKNKTVRPRFQHIQLGT